MLLATGLFPVVHHLLDKSVVALAWGPVLVHPGLGGGLEPYGAPVFQCFLQYINLRYKYSFKKIETSYLDKRCLQHQ